MTFYSLIKQYQIKSSLSSPVVSWYNFHPSICPSSISASPILGHKGLLEPICYNMFFNKVGIDCSIWFHEKVFWGIAWLEKKLSVLQTQGPVLRPNLAASTPFDAAVLLLFSSSHQLPKAILKPKFLIIALQPWLF